MSAKIVVTINSSGRQAASFIRCASAIGWNVRAQMKDGNGIVAEDIMSRDNVEVVLGSLSNPRVIEELFEGGADLAFINTTHWGDEVAIGKALADAAERAGVQHLIYSSMPDHSVFNRGWRALPLWASKFTVENYIRQIGIPATFVYCGIYHNNFTSLPYPLFRMELQDDGSFVWQAPFDRNQKLPWLDAEQDVGPAILTLFQQGPRKWAGKRITLAFQYLTPKEVCKAFSNALRRPVKYVQDSIKYEISMPAGYREHLEIMQETLAEKHAPYFGPDLEENCIETALEIWGAPRSIEEYAREIFPIEERNNGLRWMDEDDVDDEDVKLDYQGSM